LALETIFDELRHKAAISVYGIKVTDAVAALTGAGVTVKEADAFKRDITPAAFETPSGLYIMISNKSASKYELVSDDKGGFALMYNGETLYTGIAFEKRPKFYDRLTGDGRQMRDIGTILSDKCLLVWYSNECAFSEKGETCIFCHMVTRPKDSFLKSAKQIAEVFKAAYDEGAARRVDFTGGVIAERREIEYYCDAIEAIHDAVGDGGIPACAAISAPRDFDNIIKLKEAGFTNITLNLEIWDENIFKTVCPGKARTIGRARWIEALRVAADTFGFGNVRCNFVTGIEPKFKTLEGIEYLAEFGVVANPNILSPTAGTPLEGTRCPTPEWHYDLHKKTAEIQYRVGIRYAQMRYCTPGPFNLFHDFMRVKEGLLPLKDEK
jgi:hypothetical protein